MCHVQSQSPWVLGNSGMDLVIKWWNLPCFSGHLPSVVRYYYLLSTGVVLLTCVLPWHQMHLFSNSLYVTTFVCHINAYIAAITVAHVEIHTSRKYSESGYAPWICKHWKMLAFGYKCSSEGHFFSQTLPIEDDSFQLNENSVSWRGLVVAISTCCTFVLWKLL